MYDNGGLGISDSEATGFARWQRSLFLSFGASQKVHGSHPRVGTSFFSVEACHLTNNATTGVAIAEYDAYKYLTDDPAHE
jgi:hypothetical protein